jgi:hypothetical protein
VTVKTVLPEADSARLKPRLRTDPKLVEPPLVEHAQIWTRRWSVAAGIAVVAALGGVAQTLAPPASAVPAPEVEYTYDVVVRRHFDFPDNDALGYGFALCDKITRGQNYGDVMRDVRADVFPNDEQAANYVVSYAVGILCPAQIWQLRNSAAGYQPPPE